MSENARHINTGDKAVFAELNCGDRVFLSGDIYTARDEAHKRLSEILKNGDPPPFPLNGATIYYCGPTLAPEGAVIGSCGPTTSSRMDAFTPELFDLGLGAVIGKGERSPEVTASIVKNGGVYFCAIGGAGALIAKHVTAAEEIAFPELGCESIKKLTVADMPLVIAIDSRGNDIFKTGREKYRISK